MRPEIKALLWRWREVIAGLALATLFAWWAVSSFGVMTWIAGACAALALIYTFTAIQRARFGAGQGGFGVVEIDEGVVSYFTPQGGAQAEISEISKVTLLPAVRGPAHWQIETPDQPNLLIPLNAHGASQLFDVFVALKGIETEKMLRVVNSQPDQPVVIWKKRTTALH